jgi:hypothetical protein
VDETLREFDRLNVRTVFLLPGNNDLVTEAILDTDRFNCFLGLLKSANAASQKQTGKKVLQIETLTLNPVPINGVLFAGLNSASFKEAKNYTSPCGNQTGPNKTLLSVTCPDAQFDALLGWKGSGSIYLMTHVPDLIDPYRKVPSWDLDKNDQLAWDSLCNTRIAAVFAGHFHSADRANYGTNIRPASLGISGCSAAKTWVAPPLAAKNQTDRGHQARGLLLATVNAGAVQHVRICWYPDCDVPSPAKPNPQPNRLPLEIGAGVVIILLILLILAVVFHWTEEYRDGVAVLVSVIFVCLAIFGIHFARTLLGPIDNSILIALLVLPLLLYGIVSGRLTEFSGPGGWGAKFKEVANRPVDTSPDILKIDEMPVQEVEKESLANLHQKIDAREIHTDRPLAVALTLGSDYTPYVIQEYARTLSNFADLRFFIVKDEEGRVFAYFRPQAFENDMTRLQSFATMVKNKSKTALTQLSGALTEFIFEDTTNAEALAKMDRLGLDAIPVLSKTSDKLLAIADRNRIVSQMLNALVKRS